MSARWVLAALSLCLIIAGCSGPSKGALSETEARVVTVQAIEDLRSDLADPANGSVSAINMEFEAPGAAVELEVQYGKDGSSIVHLAMDAEGEEISFTATCADGYAVVELDGDTYAAKTYDETGDCLELVGLGGLGDMEIGPSGGEEPTSVTPHGDGSVTATFGGDSETGFSPMALRLLMSSHTSVGDAPSTTVEVNADGQVASMNLQTPEGEGTMEFSHKPRRDIAPPDLDRAQRLPANIRYEREPSSPSAVNYNILNAKNGTQVGDFSLQVMTPGGAVGCPAAEAAKPGGCRAGNYDFFYDDQVPWGVMNEGDSWQVRSVDQSAVPADGRIYDDWADEPVQPKEPFVNVLAELIYIPGPGFVALLVALAGALALARRRT